MASNSLQIGPVRGRAVITMPVLDIGARNTSHLLFGRVHFNSEELPHVHNQIHLFFLPQVMAEVKPKDGYQSSIANESLHDNPGELTFEEGRAKPVISRPKSNPFLWQMLLEGWDGILEYSVARC